jgi:hypothetical protein
MADAGTLALGGLANGSSDSADSAFSDDSITETIDLASLVEPPPPVQREPVVAPSLAAPMSAPAAEPPKVDPAVMRLEAFLQAIMRAREAAGSTRVA